MNYIDVVKQIEGTMKFGCRPGLERTAKLLEFLGNPQKDIPMIHVGGTNGKGSTVAMIASILSSAGYKTGMYISPHLYRNTERMTIDGKEITEEDFVRYALEVMAKIEEMKAKGLEEPTQFEMYTAMALLYFARKKVDFAIIEVGLGGRYDATNVIYPQLSVITSISYDHMDILGSTIKEIAEEKAGIIKEGIPVVMYPQAYEEAESVIEAACSNKNARLVKVNPESVLLKKFGLEGQVIDFNGYGFSIENMRLPLIGDHQLKNTATVLAAIAELKQRGYNIKEEDIITGLETVKWPCRLYIACKNPIILIDGAHNEDGIASLQAALEKYFGSRKKIFVIGMLEDKDYNYAVKKLIPMAHTVIATEPVSSRALAASDMAEAVKPYCSSVEAEPDIAKAIEKAKSLYDAESMICICGSLYLAGSAYSILETQEAGRKS
jgi:dihydrofolate synthase/folylpolyglutamate synthase